ncbi:6-carboxytetrahydropterin synthase [Leuconostoc fallax]|uniref:6-carboxy-5,6,7,8-tetrahydropterin synthase n=1 Tax=Leuconostoc fallax TaxID=1251 RepID=A0A4R5N7W2_9LACO|nr:6-carboxytetrahydropterin synthase [Leuconostoc fallax]MBU7455793.1 6-carboxytetrahydropterin synthase [Leuconostoc fallax]MCO6183994.1 6-carboxytetrahydropterin synthase [Leuconostoc fallax]TDG67965.1 hypothetical protein C5L23_000271 [Leuconostoc fallax]
MMKSRSYKFKTYLNASHAVQWDSGRGVVHPHTWEIICEVKEGDDLVKFEVVEAIIEQQLSAFSNQTLNDVAPFNEINPTLENFTDFVFDRLSQSLVDISCHLIRIEVSESPTRTCCISLE